MKLLIGGSPCQGFSFAGKQLNFDDPRSKLFFEYVRVLEEYKPDYFLLENVKMKKWCVDVISKYLGVEPIEINSALVSAQNRKRLYWTNIPNITQPADRGMLLKDVMLENTNEYVKVSKKGRYKKFQDKASCITGGGHSGGNHSDMDLIGIPKNRCYMIGEAIGINGHDLLKRVYADYGKAPTVTTITGGNQYSKIAVDDYVWRRLTTIECERLFNLPDNYTNHVSPSQRYKMLGNGWTVDVIAHIFKNLPDAEFEVLSLFDGMSCGQLAMQRASKKVSKYIASETDKHAIKVTQSNFPETTQLGDVNNVCFEDSQRELF